MGHIKLDFRIQAKVTDFVKPLGIISDTVPLFSLPISTWNDLASYDSEITSLVEVRD